ncbi:MAG: metallophosphoesterase, partial [Desulfobulbaceae bacterium]|nr:metallophosphoesterase [Desulfobulbaceae bacterium]
FVVVALLLDLYGLAVISVARLCGREWAFLLPGRRLLLLLPLLAAVTVVGCGWFEARAIRLERVVLATDKLPPGTDTLRVVQLSDVHLGLLVGEQRLAAILEQVRRAEPDLLVATGDLVDGQVDDLAGLAGQLREIRPRFGKYAIVGNHEFYAGLEYALGFLREGGFTVLRNEARIVAPGLVVAGVDDRRAATWVSAEGSGEEELLSGLPSRRFVLFLKHRPQVEPTSIGRFDLQLSGHVHQGQIFPFGLMTRLFFPVEVGVLQPLAHGFLYVNRGAGTWGPPIRFLAPPAVTLIELRAAPAAAR